MTSIRKTALVAGVLYLLTFVTSIPALVLKGPVLNDANFIVGSGTSTGVLWSGILDLILAIACVGTAVVLFGVVRRQSESAALGFVTARVLEAALIVVGVLSILSILTLRQDAAGADAVSLIVAGKALVAVHDWTFLLGPGLIPAINALCLGYVLYRSGLIPRVIPIVGLIGAPLLLASATATMFGVFDQVSAWSAIAALPIALWELSLGLWLVFKGFGPEAVARLDAMSHQGLASGADVDLVGVR